MLLSASRVLIKFRKLFYFKFDTKTLEKKFSGVLVYTVLFLQTSYINKLLDELSMKQCTTKETLFDLDRVTILMGK